jgi:hypothetical protein
MAIALSTPDRRNLSTRAAGDSTERMSSGNPEAYNNQRGGYPAMLGHHLGKGITEAQRRRWVSLLLDSLDAAELPDDPEFRAAFVGYVEWGTRLALGNSQPDAEPFEHAPVPRWGWGVAPPFSPEVPSG